MALAERRHLRQESSHTVLLTAVKQPEYLRTAVLLDYLHENDKPCGAQTLQRHRQFDAPFAFADIFRAEVDVVAVLEDNRDAGQFTEFGFRHADG